MSQSNSLSESPSEQAEDLGGHETPESREAEPDSGEETREPCPTPLEWHDILSRFMNEADHWYLETSLGQIRGRTWGSGPTLYFLNGMSGTHELYALVVWLLREEYRCVVFDYPRTASATKEALSDLLPQVAQLHGETENLSVITRDFGFQIALTCARKHPRLLNTFVCQTPSDGVSLTKAERVLATLGCRLSAKLKRIPGRQAIQQRIHRAWFPPYDPSRFNFYLDNTGEQAVCGMAQRFLMQAESLDEWTDDALPTQTLILRTEGETPYQTQTAEKIQSIFPAAHTEWLHTSGQLAFLTHPHRLVKCIKEFLNPESLPDRSSSSPS
ncbi:MAG: alpha/beta hydrolase [Planctomycetaceae bacterium]|nr:alpha/beta hydrolase [Planctomycetaceae bacterium]